MLIANFASGSIGGDLPHEILEAWGIGHDSLLSGEAFRLLTGIFLSHDADMLLRQLVFAGAVIGHTEWRRGSLRAAVLFFGLDLAGTLILLALIGGAAGLGHLAGANDVGMSIGGFGLIGLAIAGWSRRWLVLGVVFAAVGAKFAILPDPLADLGHVVALGLGFALAFMPPVTERNKTREAGHAG
ncbi:MAG: hypothetical protein KDK00_15860 [Rhodobacteraceae bacterium]|nr:hypothetical protein [Paracoccaceae bacterium]